MLNGVRFNAKTHVGRVRKINEDSILVLPDQQIWAVSDAHMPSLCSFLARTTPGVFMGTTMRLLFTWALSPEVLANRQIQSFCMPLVIHILVPLMM